MSVNKSSIELLSLYGVADKNRRLALNPRVSTHNKMMRAIRSSFDDLDDSSGETIG